MMNNNLFGLVVRLFLGLLLCLAWVNVSLGQEEAGKVAWLVANSNYHSQPLKNPHNDINLIRDSLQSIGFDVYSHYDLETVSDFQEAVREVMSVMLEASASEFLFYYSGHGIQVNGENYLMPTQADIKDEFEVPTRCYSVTSDLVQRTAALDSCASIIVLDACRVNPFEAGRYRSFASGKGLAKLDCPKGCLMAYSTEPGKVAEDGVGRNTSVYAEAFARNILVEGEEIQSILNRVQREVIIQTGERQFPVYESKLTVPVVFNPPGVLSFEEIEKNINFLESQLSQISEADILNGDYLWRLEEVVDIVIKNEGQFRTKKGFCDRVVVAVSMLLLLRSEWHAWNLWRSDMSGEFESRLAWALKMLDMSTGINVVDFHQLFLRLKLIDLEVDALGDGLVIAELEDFLDELSEFDGFWVGSRFRILSLMSMPNGGEQTPFLCSSRGESIQKFLRNVREDSSFIKSELNEAVESYAFQIRSLNLMGIVRSWRTMAYFDEWCELEEDCVAGVFSPLMNALVETREIRAIRPEYYLGLCSEYFLDCSCESVTGSNVRRLMEIEMDAMSRTRDYILEELTLDWDEWYGGEESLRSKMALNGWERVFWVDLLDGEKFDLSSKNIEQPFREHNMDVLHWMLDNGHSEVFSQYERCFDFISDVDQTFSPDSFATLIQEEWPVFVVGFMSNPELSDLPFDLSYATLSLPFSDTVKAEFLRLSDMMMRTKPGGWLSMDYMLHVYNQAQLSARMGDKSSAIQYMVDLWSEMNAVGPKSLGATVGFADGISGPELFSFYLFCLRNLIDEAPVDLVIVGDLIEDIINKWPNWTTASFEQRHHFLSLIRLCSVGVTGRDCVDRFVLDDRVYESVGAVLGPEFVRGFFNEDTWLPNEYFLEDYGANLGLLLALECRYGDAGLLGLLESTLTQMKSLGYEDVDLYFDLFQMCYYVEEMDHDEVQLEFEDGLHCFWQNNSLDLIVKTCGNLDLDNEMLREWMVLDAEFNLGYKNFARCDLKEGELLNRFLAFKDKWGLSIDNRNPSFYEEEVSLSYHIAELHKHLGDWEEAELYFAEMLAWESDSVDAAQFAQDVVALQFERNGIEKTTSSLVFNGHLSFDASAVVLDDREGRVLLKEDVNWPVVCGLVGRDTVYAVRTAKHWPILSQEEMRVATRFSWLPDAEPALGYDQVDLVHFLESSAEKVWACANPVINADNRFRLAYDVSEFPFDQVLSVGQFKEVGNTGHTQALRYVYIN